MNNNRVWIIADTHFGHRNLQRYCDRPIDADDRMLNAVSRMVREGDILIHLGDVCMAHDAWWHAVFLSTCPCPAYLIRGNHDRRSIWWYLNIGWRGVFDGFSLRRSNKSLIFTHEPMEELGSFDINIHGHLHNNHPQVDDRHILIAMEHDYQPVSLDTLIRTWEKAYDGESTARE